MKLKEIYEYLDKISPFETAEPWDNCGLQVGSFNEEIERICLTLDVDEALIKNLEPKTLIIAHHPLIFKGLSSFNLNLYPSNLIAKMVKKEISLVAMHTNADKSHLNRYVCEEVLGFEVKSQEDFIITFNFDGTLKEIAQIIKDRFKMKTLRVSDAGVRIEKVALTTGSGGDLIGKIDAQLFLTGDLKYHQAFEAISNKISLIDIGHYESERFFPEALLKDLKKLPLKVIMSNSKNPFNYI